MARRSTSERLDATRHAATRQRLIGQGVTEATADAWIAAWEAQAARDELPRDGRYWERGWVWISAERERRVRPSGAVPACAGYSGEKQLNGHDTT